MLLEAYELNYTRLYKPCWKKICGNWKLPDRDNPPKEYTPSNTVSGIKADDERA